MQRVLAAIVCVCLCVCVCVCKEIPKQFGDLMQAQFGEEMACIILRHSVCVAIHLEYVRFSECFNMACL